MEAGRAVIGRAVEKAVLLFADWLMGVVEVSGSR